LLLLVGANGRPQATLLTDLPLVWGEGTPADVLAGRAARSPTLEAIEARIDVEPIDTLSAATLGRKVAIVAQPRRLSPGELVAFDSWVRAGGRALIFADPDLRWPSNHPPGDPRRAPQVTLLDPLLAHWGLELGASDGRAVVRTIGAHRVAVLAAGVWRAPSACKARAPEVVECGVGKGRVVLVGDADLLDARFAESWRASTDRWVIDELLALSSVSRAESRGGDYWLFGVALAGLGILLVTIYRRART
jgi:hypothetical protein